MPTYYVDVWDRKHKGFILSDYPLSDLKTLKAVRKRVVKTLDFGYDKKVRVMTKAKNGRMKEAGTISYHPMTEKYLWTAPGKTPQIILKTTGETKPIMKNGKRNW